MDQPTDPDSVAEARRERKRAYNQEYQRRNSDRLREYRARKRAERTPEEIQAKRDYNREYSRRRRATDPEFRERCNEATRRHKERHRDRVLAESRERERIRMQDPGHRAKRNAYAKINRERIKNDPDRLAARQRRDREYWRGRRADPEFRAKKNEWQRQRQRERYATDPEYRRAVIQRVCARKPWDDTVTVESVAAKLETQKGRCAACRCDILDAYHLDHIFPRAKGGESTLANLQLLCPACNMTKHDKLGFFPAGQDQGVLAL